MNRRSLFRTLFGAAAAVVAAPLISAEVAPTTGYIYAPYMPLFTTRCPLLIASELVGVHPMTGPTGTIFHMNLVPSHV